MKTHSLIVVAFLFIFALPAPAANVPAKRPALPTKHTTRNIEGWTVRVDDRLLSGDGAAQGERALKLLTARLVAITIVVPEKSLAKLRAINIELDLDYGALKPMQYHPDVGWLKENGYSEKLAKCVHIPTADDFLSPFENHRMPWVVLHELAHGFHDQVIGFEDPRVIAVWKKFRDSGRYKSVLTSPGQMREHYGLTDQMEFFAEMTEAYFGSNDFYPFVTGELKQAEPAVFNLLEEIWGPLPGRGQPTPPSKS
ncbi:MAG: Metallopeptidase [Verrucomicrobiales bacterium]|nr:Metallopeptidase [Verrucomicrobiales bacterium]